MGDEAERRYGAPYWSIHRGDLQMVLLDAFNTRIGADRIVTAARCTGVEQDARALARGDRHGDGDFDALSERCEAGGR